MKQQASKKKTSRFDSEDEERAFWATHSPLDYFDTDTPVSASFPNLIKIYLARQLRQELRH